jgi:hypothetical protein
MVRVSGTPGAVVVDEPKLDRMSLRTTPEAVRTFETVPLIELEPSEG